MEMLVVTGILGLLLMGIFRFFVSVGQSQKNLSNQVVLQMEARKAFDKTNNQIQEGTEVVRPFIGETLPYLVYKDIINQVTILYLEPNPKLSLQLGKAVYKLVSYTNDYLGLYKKANEKVLIESVRNMTFSCLSPNSVQCNVTVTNDKGEYEFLAHVALMNIGGLE